MQQRFETFTGLIANIHRSIRKIKTVEMEEFNLKSHHVSCLYYLYRQQSLTAKQLCDLCEEDKANVSRSIDHLEREGYIVRRSITLKRYRTPLELTERGREVGEIIAHKIDEMLMTVSEGLDEERRTIMYQSLALISHNLQKICDEYNVTNAPRSRRRKTVQENN
ncbi:MAG: MarR family transcriptional regulator [Clostridia bacterium]|nr:MarR family transcriptional regulator [Clostridia bacterium]